MTSATERVLERAEEHKTDWRRMPDTYWFYRLLEEVYELNGALLGCHRGHVGLELEEIAPICINWLHKREPSNSQSK